MKSKKIKADNKKAVNKKKNDKRSTYLILDRCLVIFCTIMVVASCACTVYLVKQERKTNLIESTGEVIDTNVINDKDIVGLTARYVGTECYEGTYASKTSVKVYAKLKDNTRKELTKWEGVLGPIKEGENEFTITYRDFSTDVKITGVDVDSITEYVNYNLYYFDTAKASQLVSSIKAGDETYEDAFEGVVLCGDSRTKAIIPTMLLDEEQILAENGVGLDHLDTYMQMLLGRNPKTIVLNYGVNSISEYEQARDEFVEEYERIIKEIKRALPNTRIIVAAIFPVSSYFEIEQPRMKYIDDVNLQLFKMCIDLDIEFIDGTHIIEDNEHLLNPDGLHFYDAFYKQYWLEELVKKMGIGVVDTE